MFYCLEVSLPKLTTRKNLILFGQCLREARMKCSWGQETVSELMSEKGYTVSQSMIAQLESGRTKDPDPHVIKGLCELYRIQYTSVIAELIREKYELSDLHYERIKANVKSIDELAEWELETKPKELWVIAPNFVDAKDEHIFSTIKELIVNTEIIIRYFVEERETGVTGRFAYFLKLLQQELKGESIIKGEIKWTPIGEEQIGWLSNSMVIANPQAAFGMNNNEKAEGFIVINAENGDPSYGIPMGQNEIRQRVFGLGPYVEQADINLKNKNVFPGV